MALAPKYYEEKYKNLTKEELEKKFNEIRKHFEFETKNDYIKHYLDNFLQPSWNSNNLREANVLKKLLKEKTGEEYYFKKNNFEITLNDFIDYVCGADNDHFWAEKIKKFFYNSKEITDNEKINFISELYQDKYSFNEFTKEILKTYSPKEIYDKYKEIAREYNRKYRVIK